MDKANLKLLKGEEIPKNNNNEFDKIMTEAERKVKIKVNKDLGLIMPHINEGLDCLFILLDYIDENEDDSFDRFTKSVYCNNVMKKVISKVIEVKKIPIKKDSMVYLGTHFITDVDFFLFEFKDAFIRYNPSRVKEDVIDDSFWSDKTLLVIENPAYPYKTNIVTNKFIAQKRAIEICRKNNIPIIMYINQDGNFSIKSDPIENGHDYTVSIPGLVEDIDVVKLSKWFSYSL